MKQLQRLLIQQGQKCFFCGSPIPQGEASVEHLDALSSGGEKSDQNCVACCRAINTALGNLSLKDKIRAILSQPSPFPCPHQEPLDEPVTSAAQPLTDLAAKVLDMLKRYGDKVPRRKNTFFNAVRGELAEVTDEELDRLFEELVSRRIISMSGVKVLYPGLEGEA